MALSRFRATPLGILAFVAVAAVASADTITFKDGRTLEGKIVSDDGETVTFKTRFGTQSVSRRDIAKLERGLTLLDEYKKRKEALKKDDLDSRLELAEWCRSNKLMTEMKEVYRTVLAIDPNHPIANRELGRVQVNGVWYATSELDKVKEAENLARGLVKYKGEWIPKEDAEKLEQGLKKVGDVWMSADEEMEAKGFVKADGKWVRPEEKERLEVEQRVESALGFKPSVVFSSHFTVVTLLGNDHAKEISSRAEEVYRLFGLSFENKPDAQFWAGRVQLYVLDRKSNYEDFVNFLDRIVPGVARDDEERKRYMRAAGFLQTGGKVRLAGTSIEKDKFQLNQIDHMVSHFLLTSYVGNVPPWLYEGFASWMEVKFDQASRVHCTTKTSYGDRTDIADKVSSSASWPELIKESVTSKTDTPFGAILGIPLNQLDYEHLSKSWSIISMLIETNKDGFISFCRHLRSGDQQKALKSGLGATAEEIDEKWREWVLKKY